MKFHLMGTQMKLTSNLLPYLFIVAGALIIFVAIAAATMMWFSKLFGRLFTEKEKKEDYYDLSDDERDRFYAWAFGDKVQETNPLCRPHMKEWNKRHGSLLMLKSNGDIKEDLVKMIALWRNNE